MKTVGHISWFVGSLVGCAATWYLTNRYWKERNEREVNEVRESLKAYYKEREVEKTERIAEETRQACEIEFLGNPKPQTIEKEKMTKAQVDLQEAKMYVIKPEEYGENPEWAKFSYIYNPDTDSYINAMFDVEVEREEVLDMIGNDVPDHFGEFEDDAVYVRNETYKTDIAVYLKEDGREG